MNRQNMNHGDDSGVSEAVQTVRFKGVFLQNRQLRKRAC